MLLTLQKDNVRKNDVQKEKSTLVISPRNALRMDICQTLRMSGIFGVEERAFSFFSPVRLELPDSLSGVVIDIENFADAAKIVASVHSKIPRGCWCAVVGDVDSIAMSQAFMAQGISYFYSALQLDALVEVAIVGAIQKSRRRAVNISVLGCKGGIGATLLSYQLARAITQEKSLPLLLLQGNNGSFDIDLMLGKKLSQDAVCYSDQLYFKREGALFLPDLSDEEYQKYNFVVFDQSIYNCSKEQLSVLAEASQCSVLVIDYSAASIRTARRFLDESERLLRGGAPNGRRCLVCLNESRPSLGSALAQSDLETLLGRPIDIRLPYVKKAGESLLSPRLWRWGRKRPIDKLMRYVLGMEESSAIKVPPLPLYERLRQTLRSK